jgi:hypothetical protein
VLTDAAGNYSFANLPAGTYLVTPKLNGYVFSPNGIQVTVTTAAVTDKNMLSWTAPAVTEDPLDASLSTPAPGAVVTIPVIILKYFPTRDGVQLDTAQATDYWAPGVITLVDLARNVDAYNHWGKWMLEEGSRFRGYKDPAAVPYLGYKVLKSWTILGQVPVSGTYGTPSGVGGYPVRYPDFFQIANDFNFKHYVEDLGVKEIWIWFGQSAMPGWPSYDAALNLPPYFIEFIESNMASPVTGDISNSYRQPDMPVYASTYVVYCHNLRRTQAEMVHNHGHQLESILKEGSTRQDGNFNLFVSKFSGWGFNYSVLPIGRAGDTHHPPNTSTDYDYQNATLVSSDIEDWRPDGTGAHSQVNANTWGTLPYSWPAQPFPVPQKVESHWYIYWMQNMPGYQNTIPYLSTTMTNWWEFTADWDGTIKAGRGLHK